MGYHPPKPPEDHWKTEMLPKMGYVLKSVEGIIRIYERDGRTPVETFKYAYISKEEFLRDYQTLAAMMGHGPL